MCLNNRAFFPDHFGIKNMRVGTLETEILNFEDLLCFRGANQRFLQL